MSAPTDCDCGDRECPECGPWYVEQAEWAARVLADDPHALDGLPEWTALAYAARELARMEANR